MDCIFFLFITKNHRSQIRPKLISISFALILFRVVLAFLAFEREQRQPQYREPIYFLINLKLWHPIRVVEDGLTFVVDLSQINLRNFTFTCIFFFFAATAGTGSTSWLAFLLFFLLVFEIIVGGTVHAMVVWLLDLHFVILFLWVWMAICIFLRDGLVSECGENLTLRTFLCFYYFLSIVILYLILLEVRNTWISFMALLSMNAWGGRRRVIISNLLDE